MRLILETWRYMWETEIDQSENAQVMCLWNRHIFQRGVIDIQDCRPCRKFQDMIFSVSDLAEMRDDGSICINFSDIEARYNQFTRIGETMSIHDMQFPPSH